MEERRIEKGNMTQHQHQNRHLRKAEQCGGGKQATQPQCHLQPFKKSLVKASINRLL